MSDDPLLRLGQSSSEAITGVLEMFAPGKIHPGDVSVVSSERNPLESLPVPAVATSVSYVDGVTGGSDGADSAAGSPSIGSPSASSATSWVSTPTWSCCCSTLATRRKAWRRSRSVRQPEVGGH